MIAFSVWRANIIMQIIMQIYEQLACLFWQIRINSSRMKLE